MRKLIIIFLALAFSLQAQNYFGHGQTQPSTTFSDSVKVGSSTNYINLTPASVGGMLNITAGSAANWTGLKISGSGFNDNNDKYIEMSSTNYWSPTLFSITQDMYCGRNMYINPATGAGEDPVLQMKFDGDSDAGDTVDHTYIMSGTAAADPANTYLDHTVTSNKFRWGGATDYISMEAANTAGMLNIVQTASGNWSALKITGAGFNNSSDKFIDISTNNFWRGDGVLNTQSNINAVGNISSQDGTITINSVAADGEHTQDLIMNADMDSDGSALTADELRVSATPASDPTQGAWDMTITQALGLRLNKGLSVGSGDFISKWTKNTGGDSLFFICGTDTFVCVRK